MPPIATLPAEATAAGFAPPLLAAAPFVGGGLLRLAMVLLVFAMVLGNDETMKQTIILDHRNEVIWGKEQVLGSKYLAKMTKQTTQLQ